MDAHRRLDEHERHNIEVVLSNFSFSKPIESLHANMHFNGFIASSMTVHKVLKHSDDVSNQNAIFHMSKYFFKRISTQMKI